MNVDGLTRENVASHLQKYRLYLKRVKDVEAGGGGPLPRPPGRYVPRSKAHLSHSNCWLFRGISERGAVRRLAAATLAWRVRAARRSAAHTALKRRLDCGQAKLPGRRGSSWWTAAVPALHHRVAATTRVCMCGWRRCAAAAQGRCTPCARASNTGEGRALVGIVWQAASAVGCCHAVAAGAQHGASPVDVHGL